MRVRVWATMDEFLAALMGAVDRVEVTPVDYSLDFRASFQPTYSANARSLVINRGTDLHIFVERLRESLADAQMRGATQEFGGSNAHMAMVSTQSDPLDTKILAQMAARLPQRHTFSREDIGVDGSAVVLFYGRRHITLYYYALGGNASAVVANAALKDAWGSLHM
jgi:hypothetical protein